MRCYVCRKQLTPSAKTPQQATPSQVVGVSPASTKKRADALQKRRKGIEASPAALCAAPNTLANRVAIPFDGFTGRRRGR